MRESFKQAEEFLDLEIKEEDPLFKQKEEMCTRIDKAIPDQIQKILALLGEVSVWTVQRVATSEESEKLIPQGWKFVGILPTGIVLQM